MLRLMLTFDKLTRVVDMQEPRVTIIKSCSHVQGEVLVTAPLQFDTNNGKLNTTVLFF